MVLGWKDWTLFSESRSYARSQTRALRRHGRSYRILADSAPWTTQGQSRQIGDRIPNIVQNRYSQNILYLHRVSFPFIWWKKGRGLHFGQKYRQKRRRTNALFRTGMSNITHSHRVSGHTTISSALFHSNMLAKMVGFEGKIKVRRLSDTSSPYPIVMYLVGLPKERELFALSNHVRQ